MSNDRGIPWDTLAHLFKLAGQQGLEYRHMLALNQGYASVIFEALIGETIPPLPEFRKLCGLDRPLPEPVTLEIDFGQTFETMFASGNYNICDPNVLCMLKAEKVGSGVKSFETKFFDFHRRVKWEHIIKTIKNDDKVNPWLLARTAHVLAYGAKCPEAQRLNLIVALGAGCVIDRGGKFCGFGPHSSDGDVGCVLMLSSDGPKRTIDLIPLTETMLPGYCYLAVREKILQEQVA